MIQNKNDFLESEARQVRIRLHKTGGDIPGCRNHYLLEAIPGMQPVVEQVIREFIDEIRNSVEFAHAQQELELIQYEADGFNRLVKQYADQPRIQTALNVAFEIWNNSPGPEERLRQFVDHADSIAPSGSESFTTCQAPT